MKVFEEQVYAALHKLRDPSYVARLANEEHMRQYAPRLREWLVEACGMLRHGRAGNDDASMHPLDLSRWDNGELVLALNETGGLLQAATDPHNELFLYNLLRYFSAEVGMRLLKTDPKYANCPGLDY